MKHTFRACLGVHRLRLSATLGYEAGEREKPQPVEVELRIFFSELPAAYQDESAPFICYDKLSSAILKLVESREFRLIEFMAMEILATVQKNIREQMGADGKNIHVLLKLHKCVPPVPYMLDGACVTVSDFSEGFTSSDVL